MTSLFSFAKMNTTSLVCLLLMGWSPGERVSSKSVVPQFALVSCSVRPTLEKAFFFPFCFSCRLTRNAEVVSSIREHLAESSLDKYLLYSGTIK